MLFEAAKCATSLFVSKWILNNPFATDLNEQFTHCKITRRYYICAIRPLTVCARNNKDIMSTAIAIFCLKNLQELNYGVSPVNYYFSVAWLITR